MGYDTSFYGILSFKNGLSDIARTELSYMLGEDLRDHPEWTHGKNLSYIDYEISDDLSGLQWDGSEKSSDMVDKLNVVIKRIRTVDPDFALEGELMAQGEEIGDVWALFINQDGFAEERKIIIELTECPECGAQFKPREV